MTSVIAGLGEFHQVFFEEAAENLDRFEQLLLDLDPARPEDESLHAIFRCAHSVKGGAATFGFDEMTALTHAMETLLDRLRRHEQPCSAGIVDTLLESGDLLREMLACRRRGGGDAPAAGVLLARLSAHTAAPSAAAAPAAVAAAPAPAPVRGPAGPRELEMIAGPLASPGLADDLLELFGEVGGAGTLARAEPLPDQAAGTVRFQLTTTSTDDEVMDLCSFHVPREQVRLAPWPGSVVPQPARAPAPCGPRVLEMIAGPLASPGLADDLLELFGEVGGAGTLERAEPLPGQAAGAVRFQLATTSTDDEVMDLCSFHVPREQIRLAPWPGTAAPAVAPAPTPAAASPAPASVSASAAAPAPAPAAPRRSASASETLRVSVEKVDQLINLMGELVITQAMLAQRAAGLDREVVQQLAGGLGDLERTTRDLQESVMAIRMIPMGEVFQRFPRMLRDLAARLGKQLELRTVGEATELDKGMIEKITDPLTHLVRNAVDHGLELPAERVAAGKPPQGTLTLAARHEGGCILIEVQDDGRGLDRARILDKARRSGIPIADDAPDAEVWQLIFAPGFSTAQEVTDVSGRGVGMDVVRRNILALGGSVELDSVAGRGTRVCVRLPLTLAIMDGISVGVGGELYLLPLASVIESFQAQPGAIRTMPPAQRLVKVRDEYLPVVSLAGAMGADDGRSETPMLVLVQAEGRRVALEVGELVGQQQVVVKNLEANYRRVPGVSGATIMGDGTVALIVDVAALVRVAPPAPSSSAAAGRQTGMPPVVPAGTEPVLTH